MSIVAVHGPNTFGSRGVQEAGPAMAAVNPTNGLKWDFRLDYNTTRPDQDFSWAFPPDGTPTPQTVANPTEVTYAAVGSTFGDPTRPTQPTKTATLTVTNVSRTVSNKALASNVATLTTSATSGFKVGQSVVISGMVAPFNGTFTILSTPTGTTFTFACVGADVTSTASGGTVTSDSAQYPAAGSYPLIVPVATGAAPSAGLLMAGDGDEGDIVPAPSVGPTQESATTEEVPVGYDPAAHTVGEVQEYVTEHPEQLEEMYEAEIAGKNRVSLVTWLEEQFPYDPGAWTVNEVLDYAADNPSELSKIIADEKAGKNRVTLINQLDAMR